MLSPLNRRGHSVLVVGSPEFLFNLQIANSNLQFTNNPGNHGWDLQYTPCGCGVVNENAIDGSYHITPGSGNHWSDEFADEQRDYFLMSGSDFNVKYGLPNGTDVRIKNGQVGYYVKSTGWSGFEEYDKYGDITQMMHLTLVNTFVEVALLGQNGRVDNISKRGLELIANFEGFRANIYNDIAGNPTIGFGHKLLSNESYPNGISRDQALALLKEDAKSAVKAVNKFIKVDLNQHQFDALVSFSYNVGRGNFRKSSLVVLINTGNAAAIDVFDKLLNYSYSGGHFSDGLFYRRISEGNLFMAKD
ncbi:MAG: lysozyme [Cyclobacteriaceae bacterium]|nr:lysozyme [Cyclobacteriaceae bacterium]